MDAVQCMCQRANTCHFTKNACTGRLAHRLVAACPSGTSDRRALQENGDGPALLNTALKLTMFAPANAAFSKPLTTVRSPCSSCKPPAFSHCMGDPRCACGVLVALSTALVMSAPARCYDSR